MSREVRISIDDDEVFERMKHRKQELDLSWEEVLHRGLRRGPAAGGERGHPQQTGRQESDRRRQDRQRDVESSEPSSHGPTGPGGDDGRTSRRGSERRSQSGRSRSHDRGDVPGHVEAYQDHVDAHQEHVDAYQDHVDEYYDDQWDRFADSVEAQVQNKVYNALRSTFGAAGIDVPEPPEPPHSSLDREMEDLSNAEDAVLSFDFLDDDPGYQIPLRVNLQTSVDGLDVEVVAVRQGKSVRDMNRFDSEARLAVTKRLAKGDPAILRFDDGAEGYEVEPVIRWERDESGRPTVTAVDIEAVRLGEDDAE